MTTLTLNGTAFNTIGTLPPINSSAPDFTVTDTNLGEIHLKNFLGKKIILNIFPSLDTSTCASAMKHFNELARADTNVLILCISADLPFAQKRFCAAEHLANVVPASTFRHPQFGKTYGVLITDGPLTGLLSRAALIINEQGVITYSQQVNEITQEPNYDEIVTALKHA